MRADSASAFLPLTNLERLRFEKPAMHSAQKRSVFIRGAQEHLAGGPCAAWGSPQDESEAHCFLPYEIRAVRVIANARADDRETGKAVLEARFRPLAHKGFELLARMWGILEQDMQARGRCRHAIGLQPGGTEL